MFFCSFCCFHFCTQTFCFSLCKKPGPAAGLLPSAGSQVCQESKASDLWKPRFHPQDSVTPESRQVSHLSLSDFLFSVVTLFSFSCVCVFTRQRLHGNNTEADSHLRAQTPPPTGSDHSMLGGGGGTVPGHTLGKQCDTETHSVHQVAAGEVKGQTL